VAGGLYEGEMRVSAFQNGYYIALCNRVGAEDCLEFAGESFVCASNGDVVARAGVAPTSLYADIDFSRTGILTRAAAFLATPTS
jgi:beta-ureidopropionase